MNKTVRWVAEMVLGLMGSGFYGSLTLKFEGGKLVNARKEESLKPPADL